jgi:hypothetical protein
MFLYMQAENGPEESLIERGRRNETIFPYVGGI